MVTSLNKKIKILIISAYSPPATSGSGLMMYNLLSQFPADSFAIVTENHDRSPLLAKYQLPVNYYCYGNRLTSLQFNTQSKSRVQYLKRKIKALPIVAFFGQLFFLFYTIQRIVIKGREAITKEKPDILIGYSDFGPCLIATYILHKTTKIPFALYMYDAYAENKMPLIFKIIARILEPKLFKHAKHIFVMCDPLKKHYAEKYTRDDITIIYNSLLAMSPSPQKEKPERPFTIAYVGSVYWAQEDALRNLFNAIELLTSTSVKLVLYTPHTKNYLNALGFYENEIVSFTTCLPEEVSSVVDNANLVFIGLSFSSIYKLLINTSSPGRLCDFLKSNTPIVVHAPPQSFLAQYAKQHDFAYVVDTDSVTDLAKVIDTAMHNPSESIHKIANANHIGLTYHSAEKNAEIYLKTLTQ